MHYSTGKHGMFLLSTLPLFAYGIYKSFKEKNIFIIFLVICFFTGPLFLGFIGSVHRASRIIFLVPLFCLISAFGSYKLLEFKQKILKTGIIIFLCFFAFNFSDFINYYWFKYGDDTKHIFYSLDGFTAYKKLYEISKKENLKPLFSEALINEKGDPASVDDFARSLYFVKPEIFDDQVKIPENSILISRDANRIEEKIESGKKDYYLYIKQ